MTRGENLPMLPQAVSTTLRLVDDPNCSQRELERALETDTAITAKIIRAANSPYYGGSDVTSIGRAIGFLGMTAIRSIVVGIAMQQMMSGKSTSRNLDKVAYWQHSLATAVGSRILGKLRMPAKAEELYCAGMIHDIGLIVFERYIPSQLDECLAQSKATGVPLYLIEMEILGYNHATVGGLLAKKWQMSETIQNAVKYHHEASSDEKTYKTTALVAGANALAHECGFNNSQREGALELDYELASAMDMPMEQIDVIRQVMQAEVAKAQETYKIAA
ncbi:MAG: HDOD domain-containing protein [Armatimonadetes bacterium]|nr:HDOD domain-containing protein [Armatimonadota bacterium]